MLTREVTSSPNLGEELAAALIDQTRAGSTPLQGFIIILRSVSSRRGADIARQQIEGRHLKQIAAALRGDLAAERAALVLSLIAGFQMMRQMIGLSVLADSRTQDATEAARTDPQTADRPGRRQQFV